MARPRLTLFLLFLWGTMPSDGAQDPREPPAVDRTAVASEQLSEQKEDESKEKEESEKSFQEVVQGMEKLKGLFTF